MRLARIIKGGGEFTWDRPSRATMHGSAPQREGRTAQGNLRRSREKPGQHQRRRGGRP